jgi:signal transduction histidine kinase
METKWTTPKTTARTPRQDPRSPSPKSAPGSNGGEDPVPSADGRINILLVDDRPDKLLALEAVLSGLGQNLVKANSGKEALRHLLDKEFAVILLDVSMPVMDGFETAAMIRRRPSSEHTPIIFVTSMSDSENHVSKGYSLGAVDYILSPIVPEILRAKVSVFVELYKKTGQIKQLNGELQQRVAELTDLNNELEAFNYSISHDLRAPLRSMQGFARVLLDDPDSQLSEDGKECARRIVRSGQYMDKLMYDLLHFSRLGRAPLEAAPVRLESVVNEVLMHLEQAIQAGKARVELGLLRAVAVAHRSTLNMVLTNLIENAMKFTDPARPPVVRVWSEEKSGRVRLFVADNGIGIDPDHHEKIFGLFERLHDSSTYPGTGVGLAIVRKGVERMGGRVGVKSKTGEGSEFWLELPLANPEPK